MQFEGYDVLNMSFNMKDSADEEDGKSIKYSPRFSREVRKIDGSRYDLFLSAGVGEKDDSLPFSLSIELLGHFVLKDVEDIEKAMTINGMAILFPYLRAILSQMTLLANISPLILPTYNIARMFQDADNQPDDGDTEQTEAN